MPEHLPPRHGSSRASEASDRGGLVVDPVCGMRIDPATAAGQHVHQGVTYHFCNPSCLRRFRADPAAFLTGRAEPPAAMPAPPAAPTPPATTGAAPGVKYTCPMHPQVV